MPELISDKKFKDREIRIALPLKIEQRAEGDGQPKKMIIEGYALLFENETMIGSEEWGWIEVIKTGALDETDMKKVPMKYNHEDSYLALASTKNGSLELKVDDKGLFFHAELLENGSNRDIYSAIESGLIDECSFAFTIDYANGGEIWIEESDKMPRREIVKIKRLFDISVVDLPAYDNTTVAARALGTLEEAEKVRKAALAEAEKNRTA